jgi:hypothetical protein
VVLCSETRTAPMETKAPDEVADMSFFEFLRWLEYKAGMHAHSEESRLSARVPGAAVRQGRQRTAVEGDFCPTRTDQSRRTPPVQRRTELGPKRPVDIVGWIDDNVCLNRQSSACVNLQNAEVRLELMMRKPPFAHTPRQQKS